MLIIYAIIVEGNVVDLFQAGFLPGLLATAGYMVAIAVVVRIDPLAGPAATAKPTPPNAGSSLRHIWTVGVIFVVVMGGIYSGIFTPTEGAGVGAVATFLVAVTLRRHALGRDFSTR